MKPRGLLAAVIVLAALGGALYWSNRKQKAEAAKPATDTATKILSVPEDQIKEVTLKKTGAEATVLQKAADGKWQITAPKPERADQDTVKTLVSSLATLNADKVVEDKATDLSAYGLTTPTLDVTVTKKDGKYEPRDTPHGQRTPETHGRGPRDGSHRMLEALARMPCLSRRARWLEGRGERRQSRVGRRFLATSAAPFRSFERVRPDCRGPPRSVRPSLRSPSPALSQGRRDVSVEEPSRMKPIRPSCFTWASTRRRPVPRFPMR